MKIYAVIAISFTLVVSVMAQIVGCQERERNGRVGEGVHTIPTKNRTIVVNGTDTFILDRLCNEDFRKYHATVYFMRDTLTNDEYITLGSEPIFNQTTFLAVWERGYRDAINATLSAGRKSTEEMSNYLKQRRSSDSLQFINFYKTELK